MINPDFARIMARYNSWQNHSLFAAADALSDEERRIDRGAFFKSIAGTLSHLLWADATWMSRLAGDPRPGCGLADSASFCVSWPELKTRRRAMDETLIAWADGLDDAALETHLSWFSGVKRADVVMPRRLVVAHVFNHQTHHRGQVHAMLTAAGAAPADTDLIFLEKHF